MKKFRVVLVKQRIEGGRNPFLIRDVFNVRGTSHYREWEIEAENEEQVKKYLDQAYEQKIPTVMGFKLDLIEEVNGASHE